MGWIVAILLVLMAVAIRYLEHENMKRWEAR
jgi:hypothetical protein